MEIKMTEKPIDKFEKYLLDYLRSYDKTDDFSKSYIIDLPEYKFYKFKITVEPIPRNYEEEKNE